MDDIVKKMSESLAKPTSRSGFMSAVTKTVIVAFGILAGGTAALVTGGADALAVCCSANTWCANEYCPVGTVQCGPGPFQPTYCCVVHNGVYQYWGCINCCETNPDGYLVCTFNPFIGNCPTNAPSGNRGRPGGVRTGLPV